MTSDSARATPLPAAAAADFGPASSGEAGRPRPGEAAATGTASDAPRPAVVLVSPYDLGRQPYALAHCSAWLRRAGFEPRCVDLSLERLRDETFDGALAVGVALGMHTATRIALEALPRIRRLAPDARLCAFGLYAPGYAEVLAPHGVEQVFGGEFEAALTAWATAVRDGGDADAAAGAAPARVEFLDPDRSGLPALDRYASLQLPDGGSKPMAYVESTRGCKHLCRHCPVVPVYQGRFRAIPLERVMADVARQLEAGARHVSFGDPDFLNGPGHARRMAEALHERWPWLTWDAVIKVEHLLAERELLPRLRECGLILVTTAVEAVDDGILERLDKGHDAADFERVVRLLREVGIALAPTFVAFTPWTTLESYRDLLAAIARLELVDAVPPIQLALRLLVPAGSRLLELDELREQVGAFDEQSLGHPWEHTDPRVDELQQAVMAAIEAASADAPDDADGGARRAVFAQLWQLAHDALDTPAPALDLSTGRPIPSFSESWYCCAEPTQQQKRSF